MDDFLKQLAQRLQVPDAEVISADETAEWPDGKLSELVAQGILTEIEPAKGVVCNECEENCFIEPNRRTCPDDDKTIGIFVCTRNPDIGRIEVDLNRLRHWKINRKKLTQLDYCTEQKNHHSEIPYEIRLLEEIADILERWAKERIADFQNIIEEERLNKNRNQTMGEFIKKQDTLSNIEEIFPIATYFTLPDLSDEFTFAVKSFQFNENFTPATMLVEIQNELYYKNIEIIKLAAEVSKHIDSYEPESLEYKSLLLQVRTLFAATIPEIAERIRKIAEMTKKKLVNSTKTQSAEPGQESEVNKKQLLQSIHKACEIVEKLTEPEFDLNKLTQTEMAYADAAVIDFLTKRFGEQDDALGNWPRDWHECPESYDLWKGEIRKFRAKKAINSLENVKNMADSLSKRNSKSNEKTETVTTIDAVITEGIISQPSSWTAGCLKKWLEWLERSLLLLDRWAELVQGTKSWPIEEGEVCPGETVGYNYLRPEGWKPGVGYRSGDETHLLYTEEEDYWTVLGALKAHLIGFDMIGHEIYEFCPDFFSSAETTISRVQKFIWTARDSKSHTKLPFCPHFSGSLQELRDRLDEFTKVSLTTVPCNPNSLQQPRTPTATPQIVQSAQESFNEPREEIPENAVSCIDVAGIVHKRSDSIARTIKSYLYPIWKKANKNYCDPEHAAVIWSKWKKYWRNKLEEE